MRGMMIERLESNDDVEVDGAYFGGDVKPENHIDDQIDRRLAENQTGKEMGELAGGLGFAHAANTHQQNQWLAETVDHLCGLLVWACQSPRRSWAADGQVRIF
jgi:hypothetical protein